MKHSWIGKPNGRDNFGDRCRWKNSTNMDLKGTGCKSGSGYGPVKGSMKGEEFLA